MKNKLNRAPLGNVLAFEDYKFLGSFDGLALLNDELLRITHCILLLLNHILVLFMPFIVIVNVDLVSVILGCKLEVFVVVPSWLFNHNAVWMDQALMMELLPLMLAPLILIRIPWCYKCVSISHILLLLNAFQLFSPWASLCCFLWRNSFFFWMHLGLHISEWGLSSFKSWRHINTSWNYSSVQQTQHSISNIIFSDRRRISKGVISEVFWQYSSWLGNLFASNSANA